jgi:uncharacterized protein YjhX (UPF0386 family)
LNISKAQQRTLHALAQGARIELLRDDHGRIVDATCVTGEGWRLSDCSLAVFKSLKKRRLIASKGGGPYRITREGAVSLRAQGDNRVTARAW